MADFLFQVAANDRAQNVAMRMGMSIAQMRDLNYGLGDETATLMEQGMMELCVVPNSCLGMKQNIYSDLTYR